MDPIWLCGKSLSPLGEPIQFSEKDLFCSPRNYDEGWTGEYIANRDIAL